ncbi:GNAT family acetyltransferase [Fulvivirga imtechensis AK7]|uniref:GNAT family acetyltransferase n=1 Tax=Fulvivirga imtechensis AK7 TaxID=1237149 RepID=L8JM18_9BACT|nr:GNAT family N-acetyltransferase [Fulvivirga imtechensis]ELR69850.1 GNAT family acetyltransferase [Fulvivirga imtechensis AK7]
MEVDDVFMAEMEEAMGFWLEGARRYPEQYAWFTNWEIVLKAENMTVGGIGLTGLPDEHGEVMTGYFIDKKYHSQGLASEALAALVNWVFSHPGAEAIRADTPVDNISSQRVLDKNRFVKIGEHDRCFQWKRSK